MTQTSVNEGFQRVLVGIDFSPASDYALQVARQRFPHAQIKLLHITDARVTATPDLLGGLSPTMPSPDLLHTLEHADEQRLRGMAQAGEETALLIGDPVTGLLETAKNWPADLIVVGTHAHGALEHFLLGSTAEKVVARSHVPVLTIRGPGR